MLFKSSRPGCHAAQHGGAPAAVSSLAPKARPFGAAVVCLSLWLGSPVAAWAQSQSSGNGSLAAAAALLGVNLNGSDKAGAQAPNAPQTTTPGLTATLSNLGNTPSNNAAPMPPTTTVPAPEASGDPVSRFLADKGLLPSTKPVTDLAQQVRVKATDMASDLVISAMDFLGVPYRRGGQSREGGFDCSGFTRHVFENSVGLILPRRASEQANSPQLVPVQQAELKPGDLVFFNTLRHTFSHVGIYIGDNKFIHSPRAGGQVRVEDMRQAYWQQRFDGARRAPVISARQAAAPGNN
jgi:cell wall-associated NlpC family hydrolase